MSFSRYLPVLDWARRYNRGALANDAVAAAIVTIMLIPQSLAYAMLAGLPPVVGLYASILPLVAYAIFGTSRTLAVGPVAVVSLLTATAASGMAPPGSAEYLAIATTLALLSGLMLVAMGVFRLGFVANLLSHPVISGFITATGILIATGQIRHLLGVDAGGQTLIELLPALIRALQGTDLPTLAIGLASAVFLFWARSGLRPLLVRLGAAPRLATLLARTGPVLAVAVSIAAVRLLDLEAAGVATVGAVPQGLPPLRLPPMDIALWSSLLPAAFLIPVIGFVESVSVAQTLAAKRRQSILPDQELIGLGAANLAAAFSGGYPVTGGFARSVVNFDAGAETPAAGAMTAVGIALASLLLTPLLHSLPIAVLAATIIVAVLSLVDLGALARTWRYSRFDFAALAGTILATLLLGVEPGILTGVVLSVALHLWRTARPHVAILGQIPRHPALPQHPPPRCRLRARRAEPADRRKPLLRQRAGRRGSGPGRRRGAAAPAPRRPQLRRGQQHRRQRARKPPAGDASPRRRRRRPPPVGGEGSGHGSPRAQFVRGRAHRQDLPVASRRPLRARTCRHAGGRATHPAPHRRGALLPRTEGRRGTGALGWCLPVWWLGSPD